MIASSFPYRLYLVIAQNNCMNRSFLEVAEQAILGGVDIIQLREKHLPFETFVEAAMHLKEITEKYSIPLIINDNLQVAMRVNAFGIHVGNNDIAPTKIKQQWPSVKSVGYSIEYLSQLVNEETVAADYLGVSPVFTTATKKDTITAWGLAGIEEIRQLTNKPLVAIGNMNKDNAAAVIRSGADCIAVVSAICTAADPRRAAYEIKNVIIKVP